MFTPLERRLVATGLFLGLMFFGGCAPKTLRMAARINHFAASYIPTPGDEMAGPLAELEKRLTGWGITISDLPAMAPYSGIADAQSRTIQLKPGLSVNARFEVLAHEAGHLFQPPALDSGSQVGQLFAEMVGVGVQKFYDSKTAEKVAAPYLAQLKFAFPSYRWMKHDINYAIRCLTGQEPMPRWR
jgi:hypothetical protein